MTDFYSQNRCVCSTRSQGPLLCAFCLSFHFKSLVKIAAVSWHSLQRFIKPAPGRFRRVLLHVDERVSVRFRGGVFIYAAVAALE